MFNVVLKKIKRKTSSFLLIRKYLKWFFCFDKCVYIVTLKMSLSKEHCNSTKYINCLALGLLHLMYETEIKPKIIK